VVNHARTALAALEKHQEESREQVDLFAPPPAAEAPAPSAAEAALAAIDPDSLSPREALDALYALKKKLGDAK
jgi:DNA mismatch repair protein MutS